MPIDSPGAPVAVGTCVSKVGSTRGGAGASGANCLATCRVTALVAAGIDGTKAPPMVAAICPTGPAPASFARPPAAPAVPPLIVCSPGVVAIN